MKTRTALTLLSMIAAAAAVVPVKGAIETATSQGHNFQSPMILTVDFPVTDASRWGQGEWLRGTDYAQLPGYVCDNVSIKNMEVSFEPAKNGKVRVNVKGLLAASRGHDKAVDLSLDLVNSDIVVGSAVEEGLKIEENEERKWKAHMDVSPLSLNTAPGPKLRISMTVEDD